MNESDSDDTAVLAVAAQQAQAFLASLETRTICPTVDVATLRARLHEPIPKSGTPDTQVIGELADRLGDALMGSASGRFFGWVIGGTLPVAIAADWLASAWDQNAAVYATSPAAAMVEEITGEWLKQLFKLPRTASVGFVTGCQMAHAVALAAARNGLLQRRGIDAGRQGLSSTPPIRVVIGANAHESLLRSVRFLGLGTDSVLRVRCHDSGGMDLEHLRETLASVSHLPTVVCLAAGDLNRGAFDAFGPACEIAHRAGAWVHVDGAFGLWVAASPKHMHLLTGHDQADSWATDGHKWLNVPFESGYVFVADPQAQQATFLQHRSYAAASSQARDPMDWNPEWSRRARAIPTYAALKHLGIEGVQTIVERTCRLAGELVDGLGRLPGVEVLARPIINQGLVRFVSATGDSDARTDSVIAKVQQSGVTWFGGVTLGGHRHMRVSVVNWRTTQQDVHRAIEAVRSAMDHTQ